MSRPIHDAWNSKYLDRYFKEFPLSVLFIPPQWFLVKGTEFRVDKIQGDLPPLNVPPLEWDFQAFEPAPWLGPFFRLEKYFVSHFC